MRGPVRFLVAGAVILIAPLVLIRACGAPPRSQQLAAHRQNMEQFEAEAKRRNQFIDGYQALQDVRMMVDRYYFENWSLPPSADHLSHDLPTPMGDRPTDTGPTRYSFDPEDGAVVMFFEGRAGIADGEVSITPEIDEANKKLLWECWTPDYADIKSLLPSCVHEPL
jgi:hypothetical protein